MDYTDIQISIDGADAATNDRRARRRIVPPRRSTPWTAWPTADFGPFKISVVMTSDNIPQLDGFQALAGSVRGRAAVDPPPAVRTRRRHLARHPHPTQDQQVELYHWLLDHPNVLTGDSFFHLNALGDENLPGLNLCGAGRVVCLIDPVGDVYACPFVLHDEFKAGNVRDRGRLRIGVWSRE